ncbi:MAG: hypothetical protein JW881_02375 [Spirochaetales bacterium]|nr:hypothetical protein [Spirochaetales bacterium]
MKKKHYATIVLVAAVMLFWAASCTPPEESNKGLQEGDPIGNGFVVTYIDDGGGYEAEGTIGGETLVKVIGTFTSDRVWTADKIWFLAGSVFIGNDSASSAATLTIEAGTEVRGINDITPGLLVITRHSRIEAVGTADNPIIFTSAQAPGYRASGDWGGLVINGRAPTNEGMNVEGEGASGLYGGDVEDDDSGTLRYVRVEFAGRIFTTENELNGIAFQGVGSGTEVDYIQVHQNKDDGVEFFGGTVSVSHVVITGAQDDSLDWTSGWRGTAQYVILQQYPGAGDNGIEADNLNAEYTRTPVSDPTLSNFTIVANSDTSARGILFRRGTKARVLNSVIQGYTGSIRQDNADADEVIFRGVCADTVPYADGVTAADLSADASNDVPGTTNLPAGAVASLAGGEYSFNMVPDDDPSADAYDITTITPLFGALDSSGAGFVGAIDPDGTDWSAGWITTAER